MCFGSDGTLSEARVSYEKNWITAFRVKVTAKGQNLMFVQMISSKPSNILFSNLVLWFIIMSQSAMQNDWFAIIKVKVTARPLMIKIWQFQLYILNFWSFCYQTLIVHFHMLECFMERLDCCFQVKVTAKFQSVNECLSRLYFLNCWTFCCQTWYGDSSL